MAEFYGGVEYGGSGDSDWAGFLTPSGTLLRTLIIPNRTGSIALSGTVSAQFITDNKSVSGSVGLAGTLVKLLNKKVVGEIVPQTDDDDISIYEDINLPVLNYSDPALYNHWDGLTKKTTVMPKQGSLTPTSALGKSVIRRKKIGGSLTPTSAISNKQYFMFNQSIAGAITPVATIDAGIADPNDIDRLIIANSQKVLPRVLAYWSTGKFTNNLKGFSSSDIYQEKTVSLDPVLNWKFDEWASGTPTTALDSGANNYDGQYVGTVASITGPLLGPDADKKGISLSGAGYATILNNADINMTNNAQIECWVRVTGTPGAEMFVFAKGSGSTNATKQYALTVDTSKRLCAYAYSGSTEYKVTGTTAMTNNQWYHVIWSVEDRKLSLIVNGLEEGSYATLSGDINTTTGPLYIGRSSINANYFSGGIDEFAIYDTVYFSASGSAYARYRSGLNAGLNTLEDKFYPEQIMNGNTRISYVWGVTDVKDATGNIITANGSAYAMEDKDSYRYEHGWWSRSASDEDGKMDFIETIVCEFDSHPATQVNVFTSEFFAGIKEFDIYYKNNSGVWALLVAGVIIEQGEYEQTISLGGNLVYIKGIRIDVKSIWASDDVARIEEVDPTYVTDISETIVSYNTSYDRENFDSNIPIGSSAANSLSMTLDNTELLYSQYNSGGPYYNLILSDVRFEVQLGWYGTEFNYEPLGTFWADEWQENSDSMTVSVESRDFSKFLQETTNIGNIWLNTSGPAAVTDLLKEANFPLYDIDYDLSYKETVIQQNAPGAWLMSESGDNKYALLFNEENKVQKASGSVRQGPNGDFTLMFWIKHPPLNPTAPIISFTIPYGSTADRVQVTNPLSMLVDIGNSAIQTNVNVADNEWHQVSIAWQQTTGRLLTFVDGTLRSVKIGGAGTSLGGTYLLQLGGNNTVINSIQQICFGSGSVNSGFVGSLGHVILLGKFANQEEINNMAFRDIYAVEANVRLSYPLTEGYLDVDPMYAKIFSTVGPEDTLKLQNIEFVKDSYMTATNSTNLINGSYFGSCDIAVDDSAFSLEPYNKSVFFYGDRPSSMYFDGVTSSYIQTPAGTVTSITGDIDVFLRLSLPSFLPAAAQELYTQSKPSTNQRSLSISLQTTGAIRVSYSTNGTSYVDKTTVALLQSKNLRIEEDFWLRVSHDVDDGAGSNVISVYIADGDLDDPSQISSWSLLEAMTTAGTVTRYSSTAPIVLGSNADNGNKFRGNISGVYVTSGISSGDVRIDLGQSNLKQKNATTVTDSVLNIWTVNNTLLSSADGSYMRVPTSQDLNVLDQAFSLGIWVKPVALENYPIIAKEGATIGFGQMIQSLNPEFWWRMQEISGTTAYGIGSVVNNGTYAGTYALDSSRLVRDIGAKSVRFTNGQVSVSNHASLNTATNYTYKTQSVWIKTASDITTRQLVYEQGDGTDGMAIHIQNGKIYGSVWSGTNTWSPKGIYVSSNCITDTIYNVVLKFNGSSTNASLTMFVNGVNVGSAETTTATNAKLKGSTGTASWGRSSDGWYDSVNATTRGATTDPFTGYIGEVIHWNEKLIEDSDIDLMWTVGSPRYLSNASLKTLGTIEVGLTSGGSVYVNSVGIDSLISRPAITANTWNYVSVCYDIDTKYVNIFINGTKCGSQYFSEGFFENQLPWLVGTDGVGTYTGSGMYANGFTVYDRCLGDQEVKDAYRAGASLVNHTFDVLWTEESESLWDAMLAISTADLGTFYFDYDNKFVYKNALNNYSPAFEEFATPQWYFDDEIDIVSATQQIALQSNKIIVKLSNVDFDLNKREGLWSAPDNTIIVGGELEFDLSETFTGYLEYKSKTIPGIVPIKTPDFFPTGYVKIDDEIIKYNRKDDVKLYELERGQYDTTPVTHSANARVREVRVFNIEYSSKPSVVLEDPFVTAALYDNTVDIDLWRPGVYGAEMVLSRNTSGDAYLIQKLQSNDQLSNLDNFVAVSGVTLSSADSSQTEEFESAQYSSSIRRAGVKQVEITNRFLSNHTAAKKFAEYFLQHFINPVPVINVAIMGNPVIKLGDRVRIVSLNRMGITNEDFWVESIDINYSGGIEQNLVLRKVA